MKSGDGHHAPDQSAEREIRATKNGIGEGDQNDGCRVQDRLAYPNTHGSPGNHVKRSPHHGRHSTRAPICACRAIDVCRLSPTDPTSVSESGSAHSTDSM